MCFADGSCQFCWESVGDHNSVCRGITIVTIGDRIGDDTTAEATGFVDCFCDPEIRTTDDEIIAAVIVCGSYFWRECGNIDGIVDTSG